MWAVGRHVSGDVAADVVPRLIQQCKLAQHDSDYEMNSRSAIDGVASRVKAEAAATFVTQWVEQHELARGDVKAQRVWRAAIHAASGQISEDTADKLVTQWIQQYDLVPEDSDARKAWRAAICGGSRNVREGAAADNLVSRLFQRGQLSSRDSIWEEAVCAAANRISEQTADNLVSQLMQQHALAQADVATRHDWLRAIQEVAGRVSGEAAVGFVTQCLRQHDLVRGDRYAEWRWLNTIRDAAGRVSEEAAANLVTDLIRRHECATEDRSYWLDAVVAAAGRVNEKAAGDLVTKWIRQLDTAREDGQEAQREAISAAVGRILPNATDHRHNLSAVQLCNDLLTHNMARTAFELAARFSCLAIVSIAIINQSSSEECSCDAAKLQAVLRRDQILDKDLLVAPPLVRAAFIEKGLSTLEHSLSDAGLAAGVPEGIGQPVVDIEGIRSDINALKEFAEFAARCREFERRFVDIITCVEGRPTTGDFVREEFENLDLSASEIQMGSKLTLPQDPRQIEDFVKHLRIFYEIAKLQLEPVKPSYKQIAEALKNRRGKESKDYPNEYPYTKSSINRWCRITLPAFFRLAFERVSEPKLFETFGANNSICGLSITGKHIWKLTIECLRSERIPPFDND